LTRPNLRSHAYAACAEATVIVWPMSSADLPAADKAETASGAKHARCLRSQWAGLVAAPGRSDRLPGPLLSELTDNDAPIAYCEECCGEEFGEE